MRTGSPRTSSACRPGLPAPNSSKPPMGGAETVIRSKEPAEVIAKAREALQSMGKVTSPPKAFKHSRKKLGRH